MSDRGGRVFRVLFLCTGNSARSQMADAVLSRKGRGRFLAASAGSRRAAEVHPDAPVERLERLALEARGRAIGEAGPAIAEAGRAEGAP